MCVRERECGREIVEERERESECVRDSGKREDGEFRGAWAGGGEKKER